MAINNLVVVRGGGDIATGVVQVLHHAGLPVLVLETTMPTAIRRSVSLCEAVYDGAAQVEDLTARRIDKLSNVNECLKRGEIPLLVDPAGECLELLQPRTLVDAIIAKKNLGTTRAMAPITIALGPGFTAGEDVDAVVETMRGHDLARIYYQGSALPNTGVPGEIGGESALRVIHAPAAGLLRPIKNIGDIVHKGEALFLIDQQFVHAPIGGQLRGLIRPGYYVPKGMKVADIDPRDYVDFRTISDKARSVGRGVLEAYIILNRRLREQRQ